MAHDIKIFKISKLYQNFAFSPLSYNLIDLISEMKTLVIIGDTSSVNQSKIRANEKLVAENQQLYKMMENLKDETYKDLYHLENNVQSGSSVIWKLINSKF